MKSRRLFTIALVIELCVSAASYQAQAQELAKKDKNKPVTPAAASSVTGSGTPGRISKWSGVSGLTTYVLGDSNIFEDKFGKVGIGTTNPTSLLTVQGMIEITLGGLKFPDGSLQSTAFSPSQVVRSLNGLTGDVSLTGSGAISVTPSGNTLIISAPGALTGVAHDATLTGNGTASSPLGVAVPLNLTGAGSWVIRGNNTSTSGVLGSGVLGEASHDSGIEAGVRGRCNGGCAGVRGESTDGFGVEGRGNTGAGVAGFGTGNVGVIGSSETSDGVRAFSVGTSNEVAAISAFGSTAATGALAGIFRGNVSIRARESQPGDLTVAGKLLVSSGMKMFHIDHPLDPENKYLNHAAIESSEVLDVYSGNITTNENGDALVQLPEWFEALNKDYRYQLTVVGTFAQAIVSEKVKGNRFAIKTNAPNVEVSWQVTGVRSDATAKKFKFDVEEEKGEKERGFYLNPDAYGQPEEKSINWARDPERVQQLKQRRIEAEQTQKRPANQR